MKKERKDRNSGRTRKPRVHHDLDPLIGKMTPEDVRIIEETVDEIRDIDSEMWMSATAFGPVLKQLRTALGLSPRELSLKADLTPNRVDLYERGVRTPRARAVLALAHALGVPVGLLWWFACPRDTSDVPRDVFEQADALMRSQVETYTDILRTRAAHGMR